MNHLKFQIILVLLASGLLSPLSGAVAQASELNISGFAQCLHATTPVIDNAGTGDRYQFGFFDLLLPYLSVYSNRRIPGAIGAIQDGARERWSGQWDSRERSLAQRFAALEITTPGQAYAAAAQLCPRGDAFCPSLLLHNVLRTFGRNNEAILNSGDKIRDLNPIWFKSDRARWLAAVPQIQSQMISLRIDGEGDKWGEWYHLFGILAYASRGAATGQDVNSVDFVIALNELLNPLLADGAEEPHKAQIDRDTVEVSMQFLGTSRGFAPAADCASREAYVNLAPLELH